MHSKIIKFINDNSDVIDIADWSTLFDRMYQVFNSNTWIYPILQVLKEGLPEYKEELEDLQISRYKDKVIEVMGNSMCAMHSTTVLNALKHSFGLNTDEMRLVLEADPRFKIININRYDYVIQKEET